MNDTPRDYEGEVWRNHDTQRAVDRTAASRKVLLSLRDAVSVACGPAAAGVFIGVCSTLFSWAVDREYLTYSPVYKVKRRKGGTLPAWSADEAAAAEAGLPEHLRRVVVLGMYTGQRRGDLVSMLWSAYDGHRIRVRQAKGGGELDIPCHPALRAELDAWRATATSVFMLTTETGLRWRGTYLSRVLPVYLRRLGIRDGLCVHGLRKLAATNLAEAGCSTHEIASVTGHKTLAMVELYTASVNQRRLSQTAISRLPDRLRNERKTA